ncbi:MAG: hypothetical protein ACK4NY_10735 [Spirosomataceae bacterium]
MNMQEIQKIPELLKHYEHHKIEFKDKAGSFLDFLSLHYGSQNNDGHDHRNLPFKHIQTTFDYTVSTFPVIEINNQLIVVDFLNGNIQYKSNFVSSFTCSIWQPPKIG